MKREQKFEARLVETGLLDEWNKIGRFGRVAKADENGDIILFIHENESDNYSEIHYPPFEVLRQNYKFVKGCILEWRNYDGAFEKQLDDWLAYGMCSSTPCPLYPVDVYFPANGLETYYQDFEDDESKGRIWDAIEADGYEKYDAFVSLIKDTLFPLITTEENKKAYAVEDIVNERMTELFKDLESRF